jgi:hypothetical protein
VTVKNLSRAGGTPVGDVTFWDGSTKLESLPLIKGKARLTILNMPRGLNVISVRYQGNKDFAPCTALLFEHVHIAKS